MLTTAVFTGAGISGDHPAALPRGFRLRDDVLDVMHEAAAGVLDGLVTGDQLARIKTEPYKLEVVLGRLWGTVGPVALECVLSLRLRVPDEAHMLCALHLLRGGTHVTVNFDIGIELAYDLITGHADLPTDVPREYHDALPAWRVLAPPDPPALCTVSSHEEFAAWHRTGHPSALLKIHGGLDRAQTAPADVVVVDIEELGQLTPERAAAVAVLVGASRVLITGYSGADPDVYEPLLAASAGHAAWYSLDLPTSVAYEAQTHAIDMVVGDPAGLAVTGLRDLLGAPTPPDWPAVAVAGEGYLERFQRWARRLRATHPDELIAQSWAWLLADLGDLDTAEAMLAALPEDSSGVRLRHAEVLYNRSRGADRDQAGHLFRQVAAGSVDLSIQLHCLLRLGDIARGRTVRHPRSVRVMADLAAAYARPAQVLLVTRNGRRHREEAGDAYRALQQTSLRVLEQVAVLTPRGAWPLLGALCRSAAGLGIRAARLARNGNRLALIRQHRALLLSLAALLKGQPAPAEIRADVNRLRTTYRNADDLPGAANCAVTLAIVSAADGDSAAAQAWLSTALTDYTAGRPDGRPLPSGEALVAVISRLLTRCA